MTELNYGKNNGVSETAVLEDGTLKTEQPWDMYVGATNADRIKMHNGTPRYYWHRSPYPSIASYERNSHPDGSLNYFNAYNTNGVSGGLAVG